MAEQVYFVSAGARMKSVIGTSPEDAAWKYGQLYGSSHPRAVFTPRNPVVKKNGQRFWTFYPTVHAMFLVSDQDVTG